MSDTKDKLVEIARQQFGEDLAKQFEEGDALFSSHTDRDNQPELDSLDRVEFVMATEEVFGIEIPDTVVSGFSSIDEMVKYIDTMTSGAAHGGH